ncbi:PLP-dependent cysteine synthase family protein [Bremerella sp. P1]|uniref:PLP-dependent cysteine synthase family protein n=1 Tax=Bremerella sp. P1 TaxID=3026424 RepID=UPI0023687ECA|nr:cysteine synthase family protein [Bremerella sp. P1]WDI41938.1 cysteine synthase family protein [Bremerella sp. P1]
MIDPLAILANSRVTTPLVPIELPEHGVPVWCKLEYLNPSGSTKDRIARYILSKAMRSQLIQPGDQVVEASSGSTSIAFALVSAQLGLQFTAVMPENVSPERVKIIRAYGAHVELTQAKDGIDASIRLAQQISEQHNAFWPRQFSNPDNAKAHCDETAAEVLCQIPSGKVDVFVSGVGTGGTLVGVTQGLTSAGCRLTPVLARPVSNRLIADVECCSFSTRIPGVVDGLSTIFREANLPALKQFEISDEEAIHTTRQLIRAGFPVGPSSGLNYLAAVHAYREHGGDPVCLTVFPDRMERYFSTDLFAK